MFTAWIIGRHTSKGMPLQIIYCSYNIATAIPKSRIIKQIIDSTSKRFFRRSSSSQVCRATSLMKSISTTPVSTVWATKNLHYAPQVFEEVSRLNAHLVIVDDPIKSIADIKNPAVRDEMNNNWSSVIAPIVFEGGRSICLGTRFHPLDIHKTMFSPTKGGNKFLKKRLLMTQKVTQ